MKFNLTEYKKDGRKYLDTVMQEARQEAWGQMVETKFKDASLEELEVMRTLWSHGFVKGAELASAFGEELYKALINESNESRP